jgi:hypothetical protein
MEEVIRLAAAVVINIIVTSLAISSRVSNWREGLRDRKSWAVSLLVWCVYYLGRST